MTDRETFRDLEGNVLEGITWPEPRKPPRLEASDDHTGPLDNEADARWLANDDPRRLELERRRGARLFDQDDEDGPRGA